MLKESNYITSKSTFFISFLQSLNLSWWIYSLILIQLILPAHCKKILNSIDSIVNTIYIYIYIGYRYKINSTRSPWSLFDLFFYNKNNLLFYSCYFLKKKKNITSNQTIWFHHSRLATINFISVDIRVSRTCINNPIIWSGTTSRLEF